MFIFSIESEDKVSEFSLQFHFFLFFPQEQKPFQDQELKRARIVSGIRPASPTCGFEDQLKEEVASHVKSPIK